MYCLTEAQIEFMHNDIRARGVALESLQLDLLDHVCCLMEQRFEGTGDFEAFYYATIRTFYQKELKEIEEETLFLLHHKNYYAMKKVMLASGAFSVIVLSIGLVFKFMHWPGAGVLLTSGIVLFSLLFLPLLFLLKFKEKQQAINRFSVGIGTLCGIGFSLSTLFKLMHWPGANIMGLSAIGLLLLIFLPVYFFTGIKNSETKVNTVVTSILIIAGAGLLMSLVRSPGSSSVINTLNTEYFVRNQQILKNQQQQLAFFRQNHTVSSVSAQTQQIVAQCEDLKTYVLEQETGQKTNASALTSQNILLTDNWIQDYFRQETPAAAKLTKLRKLIKSYNQTNAANPDFKPLPIEKTVLDKTEERTLAALNGLTQIQMLALQNETAALALK